MTVSKMKVKFECDIEKVWNIVLSLEDYSWRTDLCKIEVLEKGKQLIEYTKEGYATRFIITMYQPYKRYEFDMENENMKGHWIGLFSFREGKTIFESIEEVQAKKLFMKPFVKIYLKKQQNQYFHDLKKAIIHHL